MTVELRQGDCREVIAAMPDCSIASIVSDPPYALVSIQRRFGKEGSAPPKDAGGLYTRTSGGFVGQQWDTGEVVHDIDFWRECYRVLKPGGYLLAFSATRSYHRMVVAIEDAGFEIRDMVAWLYGSGNPKGYNVSKGIDKKAGAERAVVGKGTGGLHHDCSVTDFSKWSPDSKPAQNEAHNLTAPTTDAAKEWDGWNTALKPALEPIVVARKPMIGTIVENVLTHGVGAYHVDACKIEYESESDLKAALAMGESMQGKDVAGRARFNTPEGGAADTYYDPQGALEAWKAKAAQGRWPANVTHDGSDEVIDAFAGFGERGGGAKDSRGTLHGAFPTSESPRKSTRTDFHPGGKVDSAARFFFSGKADANDRWGSRHPTVKPIALMRWLVRLVTPKGGTVLDPFAGSGTTGVAALAEGFDCILIEREDAFANDIRDRLAYYRGEGKHALVHKAKRKDPKPIVGGLFG